MWSSTNHRIGWQYIEKLLGHIPASDVVPERALEAIARIDVDGIVVLLLLEQTPHRVNGARIAADALLLLTTGAAASVRWLVSKIRSDGGISAICNHIKNWHMYKVCIWGYCVLIDAMAVWKQLSEISLAHMITMIVFTVLESII